MKFNPIKDIIKGKRLVIVDDSIIRGTTTKARVKSLREAGAKAIHLRVSCPPTKYSCFYGIDFPTRKELIANRLSLEETRTFIGVDTLGYLSLDGLLKAVGRPGDYCTACWSGTYPIPFGGEGNKYALERSEKYAGQGGG